MLDWNLLYLNEADDVDYVCSWNGEKPTEKEVKQAMDRYCTQNEITHAKFRLIKHEKSWTWGNGIMADIRR